MAAYQRPPVVTIMGHVDHGKTSLLDYIRKTRVVAGEAGGITQHIGAYQAEYEGKKITFIDTPGHAAFSKMRSRGAAVTDIIVLVVAADDGVKPQTVESIQHIKKSGAPYIVAINKMDAPGASVEMVKAQLTEHEVYTQGYGGDIDVVPVSAKTGEGVDNLLSTLATMGELLELKSDDEAPFEGVVIESSRDKFKGSLATILVRNGKLVVRQPLFSGKVTGSVRTMTTATGENVTVALPGMPVEVAGFDDTPAVGAVVNSALQEVVAPVVAKKSGYPQLSQLSEQDPKLNIILKTDVLGSLEAIKQSLGSENIQMISEGVGDVTESDVLLAETTKAFIIAFQVKAPGSIKLLAQRAGVTIKFYKIIYELLDEMQLRILRLIEPNLDEKELGIAQVKQIFDIRGTHIIGSAVTKLRIRKGDLIHVKRGDTIISDAKVVSLKQGKTDVDQVSVLEEGGIVLDKGMNVQVGDTLVAYEKIAF
jgi:translation initiation factor IF-2